MSIYSHLLIFTFALSVVTTKDTNHGNNINQNGQPRCASFPVETQKAEISLGLSRFALNLQRAPTLKAADSSENFISSPISIAGALTLLLLGSQGRTYIEIASALGYFKDMACSRTNHEIFGRMLQTLLDNRNNTRMIYAANILFVQSDFCIRPIYHQFVKSVYGSEVVPIEFGSPASKEIINSWVSENTFGKIENVLDRPPSPSTKLIVATTLYFQGEWQHHFIPEETRRRVFMPNKANLQENIFVDMMSIVAPLPYAKSEQLGCHMVMLPYKDGKTAFYAIMPLNSTAKPLKNLITTLSNEMVESLISQLQIKTVAMAMPKMSLNYKMDAKFRLRNLGVSALFTPNEANLVWFSSGQCRSNENEKFVFTRIGPADEEEINNDTMSLKSQTEGTNAINAIRRVSTPDNKIYINPGIFVGEVLHDVRINITETGTEAAAATLSVAFKSRQALFRADEPFMFLIRDEETKFILFSASIFKPDPFYQN